MFQDLDTTLQALLDDSTAPTFLRNADVSFETPDRNYRPAQATVNLFLFEVKENRTVRDPQPILALVDGQYRRTLPPLRVECAYLVTTWSNQTGPVKIMEEHELLGQALAWLSRFDTIPDRYLQGTLVGQPYPPPTLVAQMEGKQTLGEFWNALGTPPRPAFTLSVTIALDLAVAQIEGPPVVTHELRFRGTEDRNGVVRVFAIGGVIKEVGSNAVIVGATVTLQEVGWTTQSDAAGRFRLSGLAAGHYTLAVSAAGYAGSQRLIQMPDPSTNAYDFQLAKVQ